MGKLPTTFTSLDLTGFEIEKTNYREVTSSMVETTCAVLQKNRVGIVVRSVHAGLKHIYGIGGSAETVCALLKEWRAENLSSLKQGKNDKDFVSAILESSDDGLLEETDIPEEYLTVSRQMAIASYRLAFQKADTSISGERLKQLAGENDLLTSQLKEFPQLKLELDFYKSEYERQRNELKEAYMNLNKQQLADSDNFRQQLDGLYQERNDLTVKLSEAEKRLLEVSDLETKERERSGEISRLNGQLEAREREISSLHSQTQSLQSQIGEKEVLESQLSTIQTQLKEANETIINLQSQDKLRTTVALEVDSLESEQVEELKFELEEKITALNKAELQLVEQDEEINNLRTQLKQTIIPPIPASVTSITSKTNKKLAK
jgi:DNA repair exonuclease SbcCD ATPase subunit